MTSGIPELANHEVVTIAVFLLRGDMQPVDTEDAAVKAAEIAPGRFSWRKYPAQISLDAVRKRLWDACREDKGGYLIGSEKDGWRLTHSGLRFAEENIARLESVAARRPLTLKEKQWRSRERERMLGTDAFEQFESSGGGTFAQADAERFFRVDEHVGSRQRRARVERALTLFGDDEDLGEIVKVMAGLILKGDRE